MKEGHLGGELVGAQCVDALRDERALVAAAELELHVGRRGVDVPRAALGLARAREDLARLLVRVRVRTRVRVRARVRTRVRVRVRVRVR